MSENLPEHLAASNAPSISPKFRTILYIVSVALSFLSILVFGLLGVFDVITNEQATAGIAVVNGAVSVLAPVIAVVYRPTRPDALGGI